MLIRPSRNERPSLLFVLPEILRNFTMPLMSLSLSFQTEPAIERFEMSKIKGLMTDREFIGMQWFGFLIEESQGLVKGGVNQFTGLGTGGPPSR